MHLKYIRLLFSSESHHYSDWDSPALRVDIQKGKRYGVYRTKMHPTKRAVIGLIGNALGIERGSSELDEIGRSISVKYRAVPPGTKLLNGNMEDRTEAVNWCRISKYVDFQKKSPKRSAGLVIEGGLDPEKETSGFRRNSGKIDKDGGSEVKEVEYLENACFIVYVGGEEDVLRKYHQALLNPKHALYFGKKCCVPNQDIVLKEFELVSPEDMSDVHDCNDV